MPNPSSAKKCKRGRPLDPPARKWFTQNFAATFAAATGATYSECENFFNIGDPNSAARRGETWRKYVTGARGLSQASAFQKTLKAITTPLDGEVIGDLHLVDSLLNSYSPRSFSDQQLSALRAATNNLDRTKTTFDVGRPSYANHTGPIACFGREMWIAGIEERLRPIADQLLDEHVDPHEPVEAALHRAAKALAKLGTRESGGVDAYFDRNTDNLGSLSSKLSSDPAIRAWWVANYYLLKALGLTMLSPPDLK